MRATRERRTPRRTFAVLATLALVAGMLAVLAPGAEAATCSATTDGTSYSKLQSAIDSATGGGTITVSGTCAGNFSIAKDLTLSGPATLLGDSQRAPVVIIGGHNVTFADLLITGGNNKNGGGGGIFVDDSDEGGSVTLNGSSVSGNRAAWGGGIFNGGGTVTLNGSSVSGNRAFITAFPGGGGIFNGQGTVILNGSSVSRNYAATTGGGIVNGGTLTLNGSSSVTGNKAQSGGGIYNTGTLNACTTWTGAISPNKPDDPPPVGTPITCT